MKRYRDFLLGALIATLLFASFSVGRASAASSGCFTDTNGHWAESFICWLKDNGISSGYADGSYRPDNSITRGEMAVMLKKVNDVSKGYSDSSLIAAKNYTDASLNNEIQITLSPKEWEIGFSLTPGLQIDHTNPMMASITSTETGLADFSATTPTLPTSIYGHVLALSKVEICYRAYLYAQIQRIMVQVTDSFSLTTYTDDSSLRTTAGCAVYTYSPAIPLSEGSYLSFFIRTSWGLTVDTIDLKRVIIYLQPQ